MNSFFNTTCLRYFIFGICCLLLFNMQDVQGQRKLGVPNDDGFFPFAVFYSGGDARATMLSEITANSRAEWRKDLQQIKKLGFNTVKTWIEWAHCEPVEGKYRFENLELLSELAREEGLKVFIQVYSESTPDWVGEKYPDAEFEAQNGEKVHSQVTPGYCVDHKGVRDKMSLFLEKQRALQPNIPIFMDGTFGVNRMLSNGQIPDPVLVIPTAIVKIHNSDLETG